MKTPKISIIIPVYNSEKYLEQCLNSLLVQAYQNIEIICVDDGSTDNSLKLLEEYKKSDFRIKIISQNHQGQAAARNNGVENSTGEWLTFVDSDDWVSAECYEEFYKALGSKNFDIFLFNGTSFKKDGNKPDDVVLNDFFAIEQWNKNSGEICTFKDCKNPFEGNLSVYNKIYKKEFLQKHNIKFYKSSIMEDELYWLEAFCAAESVYLCDKILYFYRQQPDSLTHNLNQNVFDVFDIFDKIKQNLIIYKYYNMAKYAFLQHKFRQYAFFFFVISEDLRTDFFLRAKEDLLQEKDLDINILKRLKDFPLFFSFINMTSQEFFDTYKNCVRQ